MQDKQERLLLGILLANPTLKQALEIIPALDLPNWYIAAGAISQTYWNHVHGFEPMHNIKDFDLVYFDSDTSYEAEDTFIKQGEKLFADLPVEVEIRNQARVHIWYPDHFGREITPYNSVEEGISSWATPITCIGITKKQNGYTIFSPYGLRDLFNLTVRPNKERLTRDEYDEKTKRWAKTWPKLTIVAW